MEGGRAVTPSDPSKSSDVDVLSQFTNEQILANLSQRQAAFVCTCGAVFRNRALFYMHRSCHAPANPHQCSFCGYVAANWYSFQAHFFQHKPKTGVA